MRKQCMLFVIICICVSWVSVYAESETPSIGEKLVQKVWQDMKNGNVEGLSAMMTDSFQSAHQDGSRSKEEELKLISGLKLGEYKLTHFKSSMTDNTLVVTYFVSVPETIKGKRLESEPTPRMTVFVKTNEGWQWMAHANLRAIK